MDPTTRVWTILIIVFAFATLAMAIPVARRRQGELKLRAIPAYAAMPGIVGASIETGRPMLVAINQDGIGGTPTPYALASAEIAYQVAVRAAIGERAPIIAVSDSTMIPVAYSALRRAVQSIGRTGRLRQGKSVQWYAPGTRSLAFAAILTGVAGNERTAGGVYAGAFGAELALPLWDAANKRMYSIAASHDLEGQAVGYVMADYALLGDEFSLSGAYLSNDGAQMGGALAQSVLQFLVILGLLIPAVVVIGDAVTGGAITRFLTGLFGGGG